MNKFNQLQKICQETTGTFFKLSVEANSGNWSLYIYRSKLLFKGTLNDVIQTTIDEFLKHRLNPLPDSNKNYVGKYRYLKKPDAYTQKFEFAYSLGYSNFTECFSSLGTMNFNNQFKAWQQQN